MIETDYLGLPNGFDLWTMTTNLFAGCNKEKQLMHGIAAVGCTLCLKTDMNIFFIRVQQQKEA